MIDKETGKGIFWSLVGAVAAGGAFTQKMPVGPDEWWQFGVGLVVATAAGLLLWKRNNGTDGERKTVLTEGERAVVRANKENEG